MSGLIIYNSKAAIPLGLDYEMFGAARFAFLSKQAATTLRINADLHLRIDNAVVILSADNDITGSDLDTGSLIASTTYYLYVCLPLTTGKEPVFKLSLSAAYPAGWSATNSKQVGGFYTDASVEIDEASIFDLRSTDFIQTMDQKLHFKKTAAGDGRYDKIFVFETTQISPSHLDPLQVTALHATLGYTSSTMSTAPGATRRVDFIGIDGGYNNKGKMKSSFAIGDTTSESDIFGVTLSTGNATWTQATQCEMIINIATGSVAGEFTIFIPPFSLDTYQSMTFFVSVSGATYLNYEGHHFDSFLAGSIKAIQATTNDLAAGSSVVCNISDTTNFHIGSLVEAYDSVSDEVTRITAIAVNTSITVATLINSYTTANTATVKIIDATVTPRIMTHSRMMLKTWTLPPGENTGIVLQTNIPWEADTNESITIAIQYIASSNNTAAQDVYMRQQYVLVSSNALLPPTLQRGTIKFTTVTPPALGDNTYTYDFLQPLLPAEGYDTKKTLGMQIVRMGKEPEDSYPGKICVAAIIVGITCDRLGIELP